MPEIVPLPPERAGEARMVIYRVAHLQFDSQLTLEQAVEMYLREWPLRDLDDPQRSYFENGGIFLAVLDEDRIVGTGALRFLQEGVGEIKRVWLLQDYHGQGLGYRLMQRLIEEARRLGYRKLRLLTSPAYQARAFNFYQRLGFYEIPRYNDDEADVGMEMVL